MPSRAGGAPIFDALIALAARDADATLISLDRRAKPIYELCGADVRFLDAAQLDATVADGQVQFSLSAQNRVALRPRASASPGRR